jgi:hypothetical protein
MPDTGNWHYSEEHKQLCRVIETQILWGDTTCRVWLPGPDSVVRIPAANLKPLEDAAIPQSGTGITYVTAAARVSDALTDEVGTRKTVPAGLIMRELKLRARNGYDEVKS